MTDAITRPDPADAELTGDRAAVNIRMSVPVLRWRFYFAITGGQERRGGGRLAAERGRYPLRTPGNVLFVVVGAMVIYLATLGAAVLWAS